MLETLVHRAAFINKLHAYRIEGDKWSINDKMLGTKQYTKKHRFDRQRIQHFSLGHYNWTDIYRMMRFKTFHQAFNPTYNMGQCSHGVKRVTAQYTKKLLNT